MGEAGESRKGSQRLTEVMGDPPATVMVTDSTC